MENKKKIYLVFASSLLLGLTSCALIPSTASKSTSQDEDSAEVSSEEESSVSSEAISMESSVNKDNGYATLTLGKSSIVAGASFFDGCKPTLIYTDKEGEETDVTNFTSMTSYTIEDKLDSTKTYKAGEALPAGSYKVTGKYSRGRTWRDTAEFTVADGVVDQARDGLGYKQYSVEDIESYNYQNFDYYGGPEVLGGGGTPTTGTVRLLVIPVEFNNSAAKFPAEDREAVREILDEAFNAPTDDTPWESLSSYYRKSSYGLLDFECTVTPIFTSSHNSTDYGDDNSEVAREVGSEAISWLKTQIDPSTGETFDMRNYDADEDGFIDGVEMVYVTHAPAQNSSGETSSAWWNYTFSSNGGSSVDDPGIRRTFWSRWDYVTNSYYSKEEVGHSFYGKKVDPHTIIHETGHMMGAPDYYSYDRTEGPAGGVDMMDNNVGDHNAFTKMCYSWVAPKVIDGSSDNFEITLPSFTETGDFILIPKASGWNESPYDEYLILQYSTPTGLNEKDSLGYAEWTASGNYGHGGTYEHPGLMVFHVDNRCYITNSDGEMKFAEHPSPEAFTDDSGVRWGKTLQATDNTPSRSLDIDTGEAGEMSKASTTNLQLQAVYSSDGSGGNSTWGNTWYSNFGLTSNLFGDQSFLDTYEATDSRGTPIAYGGSSYSNLRARYFFHKNLGLTFNNGDVNPWNFSVVSQDKDSITLHFVNTNAQ